MDNTPLELRDVSNCIFSLYFQKEVNLKINLICTLSGDKVTTPIRHIDMSNLKCLYELEYFKEFIEQQGNIFRCSCCGDDTSVSKFGVDRLLMDAIAKLELLKKSEYLQNQLFVSCSAKTYYAIKKEDNTAQLLPGIRTNNKQENIINNSKNFALLQKYLPRIRNLLPQYYKLIKIGKESLNQNFVFTIKTWVEQSIKKSMIIIYYVHYKIWMNYELKLETGKNYCPFDNALYIKDQQKQCIYVIGGKPNFDEQTTKCFKIIINQDVFSTQEGSLKVIRIPDLLQEGYNYMGTIVHHIDQSTNINYESIYILNGLRKYQDEKQPIYQHALLNVVQVFRNNRWRNLDCRKQLVPRLDGNFISFDQNNQRIIFMFGGLKEDQKSPQTTCQLYNCSIESISSIEIQDQSICKRQPSILFTLPYYENNFLLIFKQDQQQNIIYIINSHTGQVKQIKYKSDLQTLENLQPIRKDRFNEFIQPIFDFEGEVLYGKYLTIQLFKQNIFNLLVIDLFSGSINLIPYQDREKSQIIARKYMDALPAEKNKEIQIRWDEL